MNVFYITILKRFLRAFGAGFVASALVVTPSMISNWKDLGGWLSALSIAGIMGGVTGLLQALDKIARWQE